MGIFDIILQRGKIESQIERQSTTDAQLFHHNKIQELLRNLNEMFKEEFSIVLEYFVNELQNHHDFPSGIMHFSNILGKKCFGSKYGHISQNYNKFIKGFTGYNELELNLRQLIITIIHNNCHFDIYSGKNNFDEIVPDIINSIDKWIYYIASNQKYRTNLENFINNELEGDETQFFEVIAFFIIILITSSFCLQSIKQGVLKTKHSKNFLQIVAKIYFGFSLSYEQFEQLHKNNLDGCIAFRGICLNPKNTLKMLSSSVQRGTSWTTDYCLAVHFASQNNDESEISQVISGKKGYKINSIIDFVKFCDHLWKNNDFNNKKYMLIDNPDVLRKILDYVIKSRTIKAKYLKNYEINISSKSESSISFTSQLTDATIAIVLSYFIINDKTLLYLGDGAPEHFVNEKYLDQKEIALALPQTFKLQDSSFDAVVPFYISKNDLLLIEKKRLIEIANMLPKFTKSRLLNLIDPINNFTFESLNYILKKNDFDGKDIGIINKELRKK
jgi:hypothetical protein